jgi:DNA-binding transcriptional regulator YhcF (GntR family)
VNTEGTSVTEPTKIDFRHRRVVELRDVTDLVEMLFPGNRNQQHAAARILVELRSCDELVPTMAHLEQQHAISRRTLQRARAKLSRLGLIERISPFNTRYGGQVGWRLSRRLTGSLRRLADFVEQWQAMSGPRETEKEQALVRVLDCHRRE